MAINKNDYLDVDGNYELKKALVDELIDGVNGDVGSNENGTWIKFPNGYVLMWNTWELNGADLEKTWVLPIRLDGEAQTVQALNSSVLKGASVSAEFNGSTLSANRTLERISVSMRSRTWVTVHANVLNIAVDRVVYLTAFVFGRYK